ncbi:MAG: ABC transporter permease [Actinomycetota bacterium]
MNTALQVLRRAFVAVAVFVVMAVLTFLGVEALPGDACTSLLGRAATPNKLAQCRIEHGLDQPVLQRMGTWASNLAHGDLGYSIKRDAPVADIISPHLRNSLVLASVAALLSFPLAIVLGMYSARRLGTRRARAIDVAGLVLMTLPEFVTASILWLVFSIWLPLLPGVTVLSSDATLTEILPSIWLPAITLAVLVFAHVMRSMKASVAATSERPFVDAARYRGVPERTVLWRHVMPAALPPPVNVIAVTAAWLLTGTFVVEVVFNFPGLGRLAVDAISDRDTSLILALTLFGLAVFIVSSFISDTITRLLDPRVRAGVGS